MCGCNLQVLHFFIDCSCPGGLDHIDFVTGTTNDIHNQGMDLLSINKMRADADFACSRISTIQRGGVWVLGKRTLNGQILLFVISQCGTLNEVLDVTESILEELDSA
jgi:hypothetical protein